MVVTTTTRYKMLNFDPENLLQHLKIRHSTSSYRIETSVEPNHLERRIETGQATYRSNIRSTRNEVLCGQYFVFRAGETCRLPLKGKALLVSPSRVP